MLDPLSLKIEKMVVESKSYIDSVVDYAEANTLDVEDVLEIVNKNIFEKIKQEFIDRHYFPDNKNETSLTSFLMD